MSRLATGLQPAPPQGGIVGGSEVWRDCRAASIMFVLADSKTSAGGQDLGALVALDPGMTTALIRLDREILFDCAVTILNSKTEIAMAS